MECQVVFRLFRNLLFDFIVGLCIKLTTLKPANRFLLCNRLVLEMPQGDRHD